MKRPALLAVPLLLGSITACGNSSNGDGSSTEQGLPGGGGSGAGTSETPDTGAPIMTATQGPPASGSTSPAGPAGTPGASAGPTGSTGASSGGTGSTGSPGPTGSVPAGPAAGGASGSDGGSGGSTASGGVGGAAAGSGGGSVAAGGSPTGEAGAGGPIGGGGGQSGGAGGANSASGSCVGEVVPSADPTSPGPFEVTADKNVGPLAGVVPDPIYGDEQQRYNVYRPSDLEQSAYCHPILVWANGYRDNPEQNPPDCVVDSAANRWCGQYSPLLNHLASHGFVVVASLSTATAEGDPLPTIAGLDWILEQHEDASSPYYHRLDTANIGQLGHSYGGMSTCMTASEPRYSALATICGTRALEGVHTPMLFFCGGQDSTVSCSGVRDTFLTVTDQPAFFINELGADHGSWVYEGPGGVSLSSSAAWFRAHLMGDSASREFFYGPGCTFCSDNRVEIEQNSLMME